ncbi:MAG: hypothetical protein Q8T11_03920 [Elusimicrobiota bacterium]|nr:hypothetical protein [Elusimicrobiota bacterium]
MSDEPQHKTSRLGAIFVVVAVGGSAIGVAGWHLMSNTGGGLDTSGFNMSTAPDPAASKAPPSFPASAPGAAAPTAPNSLGMVKGDEGVTIVGAGTAAASKPAPAKPGASGVTANPTEPRQAAALSFKETAAKNEKFVDAFVRRMEKKHPSLTRYGKDWAASPELRALRDQYWREKDPLKFAVGLARSKDFAGLVRKYARDPGIRDVLVTGIKEAPPGLTGAFGGLMQNDQAAKGLVNTVIQAVGLPASLVSVLDGSGSKPPDQNQVLSEIMNSDDMKKAMKNNPAPAVNLPDQGNPPEQANGFTPLGSR